MIRSLRAYFLGRALREKLLLVVFIAIGLLWWLSAYTTRANAFWRSYKSDSSRLAEQQQWIRNRTQIEQAMHTAAGKLDPTHTLNANEAGLKNAQLSGTPTTSRSGQFAIHTANYLIRAAEWESLVKFYEALQQRAPYIAVDQFNLTAAPNNPAQLTLGLRAESVEIVR